MKMSMQIDNSDNLMATNKILSIPASVLLSIITHPSSPNVTIANFKFGNLKSMATIALGTDKAPVQDCKWKYRDDDYYLVF